MLTLINDGRDIFRAGANFQEYRCIDEVVEPAPSSSTGPPPGPAPPASGMVIFSDNFDDPAAGGSRRAPLIQGRLLIQGTLTPYA
jgi:hypothetical protein